MVTPRDVMEHEIQLAIKLTMTHTEFCDWIDTHQLSGEDSDATREFLAYLGLAFFETLKLKNPDLTLDAVAGFVFADTPDLQ